MNINILKGFKLIFYKVLINIIFNYTYKITLIYVLLLIYHFLKIFKTFS